MRAIKSGLIAILAIGLLAGSAVGVTAQEEAPVLAVTRSLDYGSDGSFRKIDVYAPSEPGPWPVALIIHGAFASKSDYDSLAEAIAAEGAVVFNVGVSMTPPFSEATREVACAVRFARATAPEHGGDPSHITLVGHSAGAAVGMVVAMSGDDYARDCLVTDASAPVDALVGYEGPLNWAHADYEMVNLVPLQDDDPDLWQALDPYTHIGGNPDLVVRLVHGDDADPGWWEVPRAVSIEFEQALLEAGYDAELTLFEGADHDALLRPGSEVVDVIVQQAFAHAE
jgi:acetyl esterase/lipase